VINGGIDEKKTALCDSSCIPNSSGNCISEEIKEEFGIPLSLDEY